MKQKFTLVLLAALFVVANVFGQDHRSPIVAEATKCGCSA